MKRFEIRFPPRTLMSARLNQHITHRLQYQAAPRLGRIKDTPNPPLHMGSVILTMRGVARHRSPRCWPLATFHPPLANCHSRLGCTDTNHHDDTSLHFLILTSSIHPHLCGLTMSKEEMDRLHALKLPQLRAIARKVSPARALELTASSNSRTCQSSPKPT